MLFVSFLQVGFFAAAAAAAGLDLASLQYLSGFWALGCRETRNLGLAEVVVRSIGFGCLCLQLVRRRAVRCLGAWSRPARSFSGSRHQGGMVAGRSSNLRCSHIGAHSAQRLHLLD